jgi:hypothetical protein
VGTAHVDDEAHGIVAVSGNDDYSDSRVGEWKIAALFLQCFVSFCSAYHLIRTYVFHRHITIAVGNGWHLPTLLRLRRGTWKEEGNFSGFLEIQCGMLIKLYSRCMTIFLCHTTHFRFQTEFINFNILWLLYVVTCIIIRAAGCCFFFLHFSLFRIWQIQNSV